jgi:hypothetical protein
LVRVTKYAALAPTAPLADTTAASVVAATRIGHADWTVHARSPALPSALTSAPRTAPPPTPIAVAPQMNGTPKKSGQTPHARPGRMPSNKPPAAPLAPNNRPLMRVSGTSFVFFWPGFWLGVSGTTGPRFTAGGFFRGGMGSA